MLLTSRGRLVVGTLTDTGRTTFNYTLTDTGVFIVPAYLVTESIILEVLRDASIVLSALRDQATTLTVLRDQSLTLEVEG